jgi:hypothetical protein
MLMNQCLQNRSEIGYVLLTVSRERSPECITVDIGPTPIRYQTDQVSREPLLKRLAL